jgi:LysM repeat protein
MATLSAVEQAVQTAGATHGVRNLSVRQNQNTFEIHGQADTIAAKQQAFHAITEKVGDTGGVMNMIQVAVEPQRTAAPQPQPAAPQSQPQPMASASTASPAAAPQAHAQARTHTVAKGETLTGIAQHYYGRASEYKKIFEANRDKLHDADHVREGVTLVIP